MPATRQYGGSQPSLVPPPPRASNQSPSIPPPPKALDENNKNWNDIPRDFAKVPTPRGGTPNVAPSSAEPIQTILDAEFQRIKPRAPPSSEPHVRDVEKRLKNLYDHLRKGDLIKEDTAAQLLQLAKALQGRDFERAQALQADIHRDKVDECGQWMVGVRRLITMCRATP